MNLEEIKKPYDLIVSLGSACAPAIHLRRYNLRKFAMPLDWVISSSLSDVNRLLKNRFHAYMELENMQVISGTDGGGLYDEEKGVTFTPTYRIRENNYNIISVHDFPVLPNQEWYATYPTYKNKLNMRIERFLDSFTKSNSTLFIRWEATYDQTVELKSILNNTMKGEFHILILNPKKLNNNVGNIIEVNWNIDGVCSLEIDFTTESFDSILNGITLSEK